MSGYCMRQGSRLAIPEVLVARSFVKRALGLMGRRSLPAGTALFIPGCRAIHTFGMRFVLDVLFLDRDGRIVAGFYGLLPGRMAWGGWKAAAALEAAEGCLGAAGIDPAQPLKLSVREVV